MLTPCARGGCTGHLQVSRPYLLRRRRYCSRRCGALARYTVRAIPVPTPCRRPGCPALGRPVYCSRKCAAKVNAAARWAHCYAAMGEKGRTAQRETGREVLTGTDLSLMRAGRYREAARAIYDRGYTAGWVARHHGYRQLPAKRATVKGAA